MSIQNRLLFIYTIIFSAAFFLVALIVYWLPRNQLLAEIDQNLEALADGIRPENTILSPGGIFRVTIPEDLITLETASTFMLITDIDGNILARSRNLTNYEGYLDPESFNNQKQFTLVPYGSTTLRVLTSPLFTENQGERIIVGYLQVGWLSISSFAKR